jgi:hypothetical protein
MIALAVDSGLLKSVFTEELQRQYPDQKARALLVAIASDRVATLTTEAVNNMDVFTMVLDAVATCRSVRSAARDTRDSPGSIRTVGLASPTIHAPQTLTVSIRIGNAAAAPIVVLTLTLELDLELELCQLTLSHGGITAADLGSAAASVELKYRDRVVVPRCKTAALVLGRKQFAKAFAIA